MATAQAKARIKRNRERRRKQRDAAQRARIKARRQMSFVELYMDMLDELADTITDRMRAILDKALLTGTDIIEKPKPPKPVAGVHRQASRRRLQMGTDFSTPDLLAVRCMLQTRAETLASDDDTGVVDTIVAFNAYLDSRPEALSGIDPGYWPRRVVVPTPSPDKTP